MVSLDDAINRLSNCNPLTKEDEQIFSMAVECMKFTKEFLPLNASPERMREAINFLNAIEYILNNNDAKSQIFSILDKYIPEDNKNGKI